MNHAFEFVYAPQKIKTFDSLFSIEGDGIPQLVKLFNVFEPQNTIYIDEKFTKPHESTFVEWLHLKDYLNCQELKRAPVSRAYDSVVNAIVSFVLSWTQQSRAAFGESNPQFKTLMSTIDNYANYENGKYVYAVEFEGMTVPYCKCAFKLMKPILMRAAIPSNAELENDEPFQISRYLSSDFINHLHYVYKKLMDETLTPKEIERMEADTKIPYDLQPLIGDYWKLRASAKVKFITGQACVGKSTLLRQLSLFGNWVIMSRGRLGGFSGKADNPVAVSMLHSSIEFVMRHSNVLGDRSSIDNPLWVCIMELCDPKYERDLVWELLRFFNSNLNAAAIGYYINQKGVIFIDPYPSQAAKRMLERGTGGDIFRCRISRYAIVQAMAYYIVAKLFGWKVYCVPYDEHKEFNPDRYSIIANELLTNRYFGVASMKNAIPVSYYDRPPNNRAIDNEYPKATGIYK